MAQKKKLKKSYRIMRGFYRTIVIFSALIVLGYLAMTYAIPPPDIALEQPENPNPALATSAAQDTPPVEPGAVESGSKIRKEKCFTFLLAASDDGNGNADTIMVMSYDVPNKRVGMISIPRDTIVNTTRKMPKINAAFNKGIENLRDEVQNLVGFPIDFYVKVDMKAFVQTVEAVGGIDFNVPVEMYYHDPTQNLSIHYMPGLQHLNGQQALEVARFRKNGDGTGYPDSDIGRTKTQQQMLMTLSKKVVSWNSLSKVKQLLTIFQENIETNLTTANMLYFASEGIQLDPSSALSGATLPGDGTAHYKGYKYCYALYQDQSLELLNTYVNPYSQPLTLQDVDFVSAK